MANNSRHDFFYIKKTGNVCPIYSITTKPVVLTNENLKSTANQFVVPAKVFEHSTATNFNGASQWINNEVCNRACMLNGCNGL
jgi:hypothetical protein